MADFHALTVQDLIPSASSCKALGNGLLTGVNGLKLGCV